MKKSEMLYFRMVEAVEAFVQKEPEKWKNVPGMDNLVKLIVQKRTEALNMAGSVENIDQSAYTAVKKALFKEIMEAVLVICHRMASYALQNKNMVLHKMVDHTYSSLSKGVEENAIARCMGIIEKARAMKTELAPFMIDAELLDKAAALIGTYSGQVKARTNVKLNKTAGLNDIAAHKASLKADLELLDNMVFGFIADKEFINAYKTVRKMDSSRSRKPAATQSQDKSVLVS